MIFDRRLAFNKNLSSIKIFISFLCYSAKSVYSKGDIFGKNNLHSLE